jgi:hydroxypyruvate reductase
MTGAHALLRSLFSAAIAAVEPRAAVRRHLLREGDVLMADGWRHDLAGTGRVVVIGAGKASAAMALGLEDLVGDRISGGVVVVKTGHTAALTRVTQLEAAHPVPDAAGEAGACAIESALTGLGARDLVLACWSGGASALLPAPRPGLTLADKQEVTRLLLASGGDIAAMNAVRRHCSRLKGGQLARRAAPATVLCLAVSDVVGDDLATIGSGPFAPDPSTFAEVDAIVRRLGLASRLPPAVAGLIADGLAGRAPETPKGGDPCFARVHHHLVASNALAVEAAATAALAAGYRPVVWREPLTGEARAAGATFAAAALHQLEGGGRVCLIAGGETTVTLGNAPGTGGRNQEFALAAAGVLGASRWRGAPVPVALLAGGSDGNDGPTDAAGAIVDGTTVTRARAAGLDLEAHLARHDAYPFFDRLGDLLRTGPTGTNVMDVDLALVG